MGRNFCVRYGEHRRDDEWAHSHGQAILLDNGAYSVWTKKQTPDWDGYYAWTERWLEFPTTWAVIPDVIEGTERDNELLIEEWPHGARGAPVWHMHEHIERLMMLASKWPRVCIGSSGAYAEIGTRRWHFRMTEAFNNLCGTGPVPIWLHGLRMMSTSGQHYPFASVDSTDLGRNHAGNNQGRSPKDVVKMAERWDAAQCPSRWTHHEALELALP